MRELFNFESILAIVFFILSVLFIVSTIRNKKKLGKLIVPTINGFRHSSIGAQSAVVMVLLIFTAFGMKYNPSGEQYRLFYFFFPSALFFYMLNSMILLRSKTGMYQNGILTSNGIVQYKGIQKYEMKPLVDKKITKVKLTVKKGWFFLPPFLIINTEMEHEIKSYLKKRC